VPSGGASTPTLAVRNVEVVYGSAIHVLRGVSLEVPPGSIVALLGANGAGKTTLLRAVSGLLRFHRGSITKGSVELEGEPIDGLDAAAIVRRGMAQVMEGRRIFAELTVDENLRAGAYTRLGGGVAAVTSAIGAALGRGGRPRGEERTSVKDSYEHVLQLFPLLRDRLRSTAGYLSGGEQQMLAMGRALMAAPRLLVLDEPSLGLAPLIVQQIRQLIVEIKQSGTDVLLVEQNATMALSIANHGYVLENGLIAKDGPGPALLADADIQEFYLGVGETGGRSFRDLKTYRRRKRWSA
jgi:branched-chain amino acid transport system ATP-binding protein